MKNETLTTHLLPTESASELFIDTRDYQLYAGQNILTPAETWINQCLYLCGAEAIKEGNWAFNTRTQKVYCANANLKEYLNPDLRKILFTTDPKLIADGVGKIDGNTNAEIRSPIYPTNEKPVGVNFLEEFCRRCNKNDKKKSWKYVEGVGRVYSKKDNQKGVGVVTESDFEDILNALHDPQLPLNEKDGAEECFRLAKKMVSQALQNTGRFSLEDMKKCFDESKQVQVGFNSYIQSLTEEQPKGDIVIECEMEKVKTFPRNPEHPMKIKLDNNGQPTLIFK